MKQGKQDKGEVWGGVHRDQRVENRRNKLLEAGLEEIGTNGYAKARIKDICKLAGLTERYFYESFKNKEELLSCIYKDILDELIDNLQAHLVQSESEPQDAITAIFRQFYDTFQKDPRKARILYFEIELMLSLQTKPSLHLN